MANRVVGLSESGCLGNFNYMFLVKFNAKCEIMGEGFWFRFSKKKG